MNSKNFSLKLKIKAYIVEKRLMSKLIKNKIVY